MSSFDLLEDEIALRMTENILAEDYRDLCWMGTMRRVSYNGSQVLDSLCRLVYR
jgi:hypothetical protein